MKLAILLHAYQPPTQYPHVTKEITKRSYLPFLETIERCDAAKITLNLSGSLIEQLIANNEHELLDRYKTQVLRGAIECTATAAYHPLLTKLPESEIFRQNLVNEYWLTRWMGDNYKKPHGFFVPEMFYDHRVGDAIEKMGYEWIVLDESAFPGAGVDEHGQHNTLSIAKHYYKKNNGNLGVFFRDRPISLAIAFDHDLTERSLLEMIQRHGDEAKDAYVIIAVDAETFGYHHAHNLNLLTCLCEQDEIQLVTLHELYQSAREFRFVEPVDSSWGISLEEHGSVRQFPRWDNPENKIQQLQWKLFNLAVQNGKHASGLPDDFDKSLHSDQFWWASKYPCWHPGMIEQSLGLYESVLGEDAKEIVQLREVLATEEVSVINC